MCSLYRLRRLQRACRPWAELSGLAALAGGLAAVRVVGARLHAASSQQLQCQESIGVARHAAHCTAGRRRGELKGRGTRKTELVDEGRKR